MTQWIVITNPGDPKNLDPVGPFDSESAAHAWANAEYEEDGEGGTVVEKLREP